MFGKSGVSFFLVVQVGFLIWFEVLLCVVVLLVELKEEWVWGCVCCEEGNRVLRRCLPFINLVVFKGVRGLMLSSRKIITNMGPIGLNVTDVVYIIL